MAETRTAAVASGMNMRVGDDEGLYITEQLYASDLGAFLT